MSRMRILLASLLLPGLFASAVRAEVPTEPAAFGAVLPGIVVPETNTQATVTAMMTCRREPAALERLDCYDRILAPEQPGFEHALVKASYEGEAWKRAFSQEKTRQDNTTTLMMTQSDGERPTVIITTPAIGNVPPRPVLMFSCVDNITRMQVALTRAMTQSDIAVTLTTDTGRFQSHWFIRENGTLLESSRGLSGIDEIKQLFGAKTLTIDTGSDSAAGKLTFNIDGLGKTIAPLREACHWAGE
ncbi:type VI secretion system-associated protein VasI [Salmonella enterica]|uniref:type VI secretion system-associated protein VasI n=1 Tax=Salmonella enterica TaxID=28901 RepID=UPI001C496602|nr:type VI secretion system-associated protein VasI [Salmonella enterica]